MRVTHSKLAGIVPTLLLLLFAASNSIFPGLSAGAQTTLSATAVAFGNAVVNEASGVRQITLKNTQAVSLTIDSIALPGGGYAFDRSTTCANPGTLAAGTTCIVGLTLTPTALGAVAAGSLTITTDASNSPQTVALTGTGVAPTVFSATAEGFGNVVLNTSSPTHTIALRNNQSIALHIASLALPAGSSYALTTPVSPYPQCPTAGVLAAYTTCVIGLTLTPQSVGAQPATLTVTTDAGNSPQTVALTGTGVAPTVLSTTTQPFGNVLVNSTSSTRTIALRNNQSATLHIASLALPAGSGYAFATPTSPFAQCPTAGALAAGATCAIGLTLTPLSLGAQAAALTITTDANNSPQMVTLSGTGVAPTVLSATAENFGLVAVNESSSTRTVALRNNQSIALHIASLALPAGSGYALTTPTSTYPQCPTSGALAAGATCAIGLTLTPLSVGAQTAALTITTDANNSPQTVALTGTGVVPTVLSATVEQFGLVAVNETSSTRTVALRNNQSIALHIASLALPAGSGYALATPISAYPQCPTSGALAAGATCAIGMTFTPSSVGAAVAGALTITTDASNSPQTVALTGEGIAPTVLSATAENFGVIALNETSSIRTIVLHNNQPIALNIASLALPAGSGYALATPTSAYPQCPTAGIVAAGMACAIGLTLTPQAVGPVAAGSLTITTDASNSPLTVTLTGSGIQPAVLFPVALSFPAQYEGATSAPETVTVANEQTVPLNIASVSITGPNAGDFAVTSLCPTTPAAVPPSSHCTLSVTFTPSGSGRRTATLSVADGTSNSPQTVALSGSGNAPVTVTPESITNFSAAVGTTSAYQTVTITNSTLSNTVNLSAIQLSGDFKQTSTTCPTLPYALAPGASCVVTVSFAPTVSGTRDGQLLVLDDAVTSPQVVNLSGTGTAPLTVSPGSLTFSAQKLGTLSPPMNVTLTNHASEQETFTLTPSANFTATSNCATGVIAANSSCVLSVVFAPGATATPGPLTGTLAIADSAPGAAQLTVQLKGSATTLNPPAAVSVVSPGAAAAGTVNLPVTITGNGLTHFSTSSVITFTDTDSASTPSGISYTITTATANTIAIQLTVAADAVSGARAINVVTPLAGGGTETALLNSAFLVTGQSNVHSITAISPACGIQGQTLNVDLTFSGMSFVPGTSYANFGDGITVNSLTAGSTPEDVIASITISNTTPVGGRTVTLVTGGDFATSTLGACQVGPNAAQLLSVNPNTAAQGWSGQVVLTTSGTHFLQNATTVSIGGGVVVGDVTVSGLTATAQVSVPANAAVGLADVTVATGGEIATLPNGFAVTGATPALVSVTPSSAQQGQTLDVTITGNAYTNFVAGQLTADLSGEIHVNGYSNISAHSVTVSITVSLNASTGAIAANLVSGPAGSQTIFPFTFTVTPSAASIVSVAPNTVAQGAQVTLAVTGLNTHWVQGTTTAAFLPSPFCGIAVDEVTILDTTDATLHISVPAGCPVGSYTFYMATGGEVVYGPISVYANTPSVTMNPANGLPGQNFPVMFTGAFTHFGANTFAVVSGEGVTLSNFTPGLSGTTASATLTIAPDALPGQRTITLTTIGEVVTTSFEVGASSISVVSPYQGLQNTTLTVAITGVNTHFVPGTTQVLLGPQITVNSVTVIDATHLTANITTSYLVNGVSTATPTGWQSVYVNTGSEEEIAGFLVLPPATASPMIVSVVPSSAAQGSTAQVTITGSLTNWVQGVTEAILGAGVTVATPIHVTGPTTAVVNISVDPLAPVGTNSVVMITGGGTSAEIEIGGGFTVTPGAANVVSVEPPGALALTSVWVVSQLQTSTLNLVGVGTHWLQGETTVSFGPGVVTDQLTVTSPTTATVQITVLSSAAVGFATLTVATGGEVIVFPQALDIEEGYPALLNTSPGGAKQGDTLDVQVLGRFTNWHQGATTAAFAPAGDITVNSITVVDSENAVLHVTVSPTANVDPSPSCHSITITTGTEQVSLPPPGQTGQFCVSQGPAEITGVSPATGVQGSTGTVTITGSSTHFTAGVTQVSFNDSGISVGTVTVTSPTSLSVPVSVSTSSSTGFHTVTATTLGEVATQQFAFQVVPGVATLTEAIPNSGVQGAPLAGQSPLVVQLIGQYSHFSAASTAVFGAGVTVQSVNYVSATEIDATITIDPLAYQGGRTVTVTTPDVPCAVLAVANVCAPGATTGSEIVTAGVFSVVPGPAIISMVAPGTGNQGQEVVFVISGDGTHWQQNFTQFWMDGIGQDLTVNSVVINSATSATVDLTISPTANPGARTVSMVTAGEALSDSGAFVVTGGIPVITNLSPNNANPGTSQLLVTINGLDTQWDMTTTKQPNFGPGITVTSYQVDDATHIEAVINIDAAAQIGYRTVTVTTGAQVLTSNFLVAAPAPPPTPYISFYYPYSGLTGQTLTINFTGAYTHWDPGPVNTPTTVTFGDGIAVNTFQVTSPTSALATVTINPAAVTGARLIVFTTGTETESAPFNVVSTTPGMPGSVVPVLSLVDPGTAIQGTQNILVNILGQYTAFDSTTTFSFGSGITVNGAPTILGPTIARQSISIGQESSVGGYPVASNTPDAPSGAQSAGGAVFTVTPSLALVSAVTPNIARQGDSLTVDVSGQNTHWDSSTTFSFGAGILVSGVSVNSATDATMTLSIPALASLGPTGITAQTGGETATLNNGFVVQAGTPLLLSSGPGSLPQQSSATFTILSQATNWSSANPPTVDYGGGVTVTNVNVTSATSLTVSGYVQPTAVVGYRNLTVTSGSQVLGLQNALYVSQGPAAINTVTPSSGGQGANLPSVQIMGTNTNWQQGVTSLSFPGVSVNSFSVTSATTITANITVNESATPGQVSVTATTGGEVATETNAFTVIQTAPELLNANPNSGAQGLTENVTIAALYSHFASNSVVSFGAGISVNSVTASSSISLVANVTVQPTASVGQRTVTVTTVTATGTETVSLANAFQVTTGPAAVLSLNPASGAQYTTPTVVVTGSQSHFANGVTTASIGGGISVTSVTVTDALHASVALSIPAGTATGAYDVSLTTGGEVATILGGFTVTAGVPQVHAVNPATSAQGTANVSVALTGLFTHFVNGTSVASFGAGITVNSLVVTDATDAVANITVASSAAVGLRTVTVTTGTEVATITGGFSVSAGVPAVASVAPSSAQAGTTGNELVTGAFTSFQQGVSTVSFGAGVTVNSVTVSSATKLTANVTIDPTTSLGTRDVTVTTGAQAVVLGGGFTVTAGVPQVHAVNPATSAQGTANVSVALTGLFTHFVNGTSVASFGAGITVNSLVVTDATDAVANITVASSAAVGLRTVTVTTGTEVATITGGFSVSAGVPAVASVAPSSAQAGTTGNELVTGAFTSFQQGVSTVSFGAGVTVNSVTVSSATKLTANVTIDPTTSLGTRDVTVTTGAQAVVLGGGFTVTAGVPQVHAVNPATSAQGTANVSVALTGLFTHFVNGTSVASFGAGITVNSLVVTDATDAVANITVASSAAVGLRTVTVTTGTEVATITGGFSVSAGVPAVASVAPSSAQAGTTGNELVTGAFTSFQQGVSTVSFGAGVTVNSVTVSSATKLTANVTIDPTTSLGTRDVTVTTGAQAVVLGGGFTVTAGVPQVHAVNPATSAQGTANVSVALTGLFTHFVNGTSVASFGAGITVNSLVVTDATDAVANITVASSAAVGLRTVTVTTGTEVATITGGFSVSAGVPAVASVAPSSAQAGTTGNELVTGAFTSFQQGVSTVSFGAGVTVNSVTVSSATKLTANVTIDPTTSLGTRDVTVTTGAQAVVLGGGFTVTAGVPQVHAVNPATSAQGTANVSVALTGLFTHFVNGTSVASFGAGITVNSLVVTDATDAVANITVASSAAVGLRTVTVTTGTEVATITGGFSVSAGVPAVASVAPSSAQAGTTGNELVTGAFTSFQQGVSTVSFGAGVTVNSVTVSSATKLTANVTIDPTTSLGTRDVTVTTGAQAVVLGGGFTVTAGVPQVHAVNPATSAQGTANVSVALTGLFTHFVNGTSVASFGAGITVNSLVVTDATDAVANITVASSAAVGLRTVTVTTGTEVATITGGFSVSAGVPAVASVAPSSAQAGTTGNELVTGAFTSFQQGVSTVSFGAGVTVNSVTVSSATKLTANVTIDPTTSLGTRDVTVTTGAQAVVLGGGFTVTAGVPQVHAVNPATSAQGTANVSVALTGLFTHFVNGTSVASFGAGITVNSLVVTDATDAVANITVASSAAVGLRTVTVTTGTEVATITGGFSVSAGVPAVASVAPSSAQAGTTGNEVVTGAFTSFQQGVSTVSFGAGVTVNSVTVSSATKLTANVTIDPTATLGTRDVTVTTGAQAVVLSGGFTVTAGVPQVHAVNPATSAQGTANVSVALTGLFTHFVNGTSVASFGAGITVNSLVVTDATDAVANITVASSAAVGLRTVTVTTGTEVATITGGFSVSAGVPAVASVAPSSAQAGTTGNEVVTGAFTSFQQGVSTVSFGAGVTVNSVTVSSATKLTANVTIDPTATLGVRDVTVTTGAQAVVLSGGFTVTAGVPQVHAVNPATSAQGTANVSVALTGLFTHFVNGTSVASFGAGITVNSLVVTDATDAVANITVTPSAAVGSRNVTVTTGTEVATITGGFSVLAGVPALVSATPGMAQAGATANVVVTGAFTSFQASGTNATTVSFGAGVTVNSVTVSSATQLTANVTLNPNATVGPRDVTATTGNQTVVLSDGFTVTPGTPAITVIDPNVGVPNAAVSVTLTGQYTNWGAGTTVSFGAGISVGGGALGSAGPVASASATNLMANLTIDPAAALGPRDVTVTTGSEVEVVAAGFTVQPTTVSPPTVASISPTTYAPNVPVNGSIVAVFSQPMARATITSANVLLYLTSNPGQGSVQVSGNAILDASGRVLTFTPAAALAVNSSYQFTITNAVTDASGNSLGGYYSYFGTGFASAAKAPTVVLANPPVNASSIGTNVPIELLFSTQMNQSTQTGLTLTAGGVAVPGSFNWATPYGGSGYGFTGGGYGQCQNEYYYYYYYYDQDPGFYGTCPNLGSILTFTPAAALQANTLYTVAYGTPLADVAGNALTPGSFSFTTGSGADTTYNSASTDFNGATSVGTNFAPTVTFSKPINPLAVNAGTLYLYNVDSNKYLQGTVTLAPNAMSATFTPAMPLLPDTEYDLHMSYGYYDADGNYSYGVDGQFTTGAGKELQPPQVTSVFPMNAATAVPLNAQFVAHFSEPLDPATTPTVTLTPAGGGSAVTGVATLLSDQVTLTFVPTESLAGGKKYTVQVSGYVDMVGNAGATFSSNFTTATSVAPLSITTGIDASGHLITTGDTVDPHWTAINSNSPNPQPVDVVTPANTGYYSGWPANGPGSAWITVSPDAVPGEISSTYSTTFNLSGYNLNNLCLVGTIEGDPYGTLSLNGTAITPLLYPFAYNGYNPYGLSVALPASELVAGVNTLSYQFQYNYSNYEGLRMQASVQTCGVSLSGLALTSSNPASGATGVAPNASVTLTFNNPIDPATVNSATLPVDINGSYNGQVIAGSYVVSGSQVTFTPDSPFPVNTSIYMQACNGPADLAGDTFSGCQTLATFTTAAAAAPGAPAVPPFQVVAFTPAANAANVGLRAPVVATFNRSVNPATVNPYNAPTDFALFQGDGQSPLCTNYMKSQDNSTLAFNCYSALPASATLTAMLNGGLQDFSGNALTNFTSAFTTSGADSSSSGTLVSAVPGSGSGGVAANVSLVLYFNTPVNTSSANGGLQVAVNGAPIAGSVKVLDGGYTLQFTPSTPFAAGGLVQWNTTSTLTDATYGNVFTAASGYFTVTADMSAAVPTVQATSPGLYTYAAAANSLVDIQFNVPLDPGTVNSTNVYLYDTQSGLNIAATYTQPQPNEVRIVPQSNFSANDYVSVYVTSGLQSTTGVPASGSNNGFIGYFYVAGTVDTTTPTVLSAVPYNGAQNVGVNVQPGFVFSKAIDAVSVNASTLQVLNGGTALAGSYLVSSDDTRVKFVPNQPLPTGTTLTLSVEGVLDQVGNTVSRSTQFQTGSGPDLMAPAVVQTSVPNGATVPANVSITVQFSESMDVTTLSTNNFYIYDNLSVPGLAGTVPATISWNADQTVAYLVPTSPLSEGDQYSLGIQGGTDLAGNPMLYYYTSFTVGFGGASSAPTVLAFNPLVSATGVGTNTIVEAEFSAAIDPTTLGAVTLSTAGTTLATTPVVAAGNTVVQLVPSVPLTANTKYTMTISGVKDPAGNAVATATNSFTTGGTFDLTAATVVSVDPPNYATVGTNVTPKVVFSKPLNPIYVSNASFTMRLPDTGQLIPLTVTLAANALVATLTPQVALIANTQYYFYGSGLQDENGNGVSTGYTYFYTGSGAVAAGPTVTAVSPVAGATAIPLNAQVTVSMSAVLDPTSVTQTAVQLLDSSNHPVAGTVSQPDNQTLLFVPTANLAAGSVYTVKVGGFADANGNAAVPHSSTFTTGGMAATAGLTLTSSNIASGSTNVSNTQQIVLVFSQLLNPDAAGTINLYLNGYGSEPMAGSQAVSGNTLTFSPTSPYPAGSNIYVYACGTTDVLGDVYNGGCYGYLLYFAVSSSSPDTTPLKVVSESPAKGASNVGLEHGVSVTFNKPVNPSSVSYYNNNALLYAGQSQANNGSVSLSADNQTVTFNNGSLQSGTAYTIEFPAGGVKDLSGNTLASDFLSSFTTTTDPLSGSGSVVGASPVNGASGVATASLLTLYVNRPVNVSTLSGNFIVTVNGQVAGGTAVAAGSGYEIQFTPDGGFPSGATVQWFFSNVQDVYGNIYSTDSGYFLLAATVDPATAQPVIVAVSPIAYSRDVPVNAQIDLEYSQPLDPATVNSSNVYFLNSSVTATVTLPLPNVIRVTPGAAFSPSTTYYVCATAAVTGTNGVATQDNCYYGDIFTTVTSGTSDTTAGTVSIGPPNSSVNLGTNAYIRLQFSKPVDKTTVNATNVSVTAGGAAIPGSWSYNYTGYYGSDVTAASFNPLNPLPASTKISVSAKGLLDYAGNTFTAASAQFTTAALPDFTTPTVALDFGYNTTGVGTNASFTCRYSKAMDPSSITPSGTYLYSYATGTNVPVTYAFSPDLMAATMTPTSPLAANTQYYYYCDGAIDLTGNGQQGNQAYFTTGSGPVTTGPLLVAANPPNGYTSAPLNSSNGPWNGTSLQLQFSEPVSENSLGGITLTPNGGSPLAIGVYPQDADTILSVTLPTVLLPNTTYTFNVSGVTDYNGNAMTPATSSFTTGSGFDFNNPVVTAEDWTSATMMTPAALNGATGVDDNPTLSVVFSEAMDPVLLDGNHIYLRMHNTQALVATTFSLSADLTTAYLKPTAPLATGTIYDVVTSTPNWYATDIAGNPFYAQGVVATFTTQ